MSDGSDLDGDSLTCEECGVLVVVTMHWDQDPAQRFECFCTTARPDDLPEHWGPTQRPLSSFSE